jgi:hypothetical protein
MGYIAHRTREFNAYTTLTLTLLFPFLPAYSLYIALLRPRSERTRQASLMGCGALSSNWLVGWCSEAVHALHGWDVV